MKLVGLYFVLAATCAGSAILGSLTVDATADIYSAGHSVLPNTIYPGSVAPSFGFSGASGDILTFSSVTGTVGCNFALTNGPDGTCAPGVSTTVTSYDGLSGISANQENFFLVGVFIGATEPADPAPAVLSYDYGGSASLSTSAAAYHPLLDQVFFVGDGLTGTGSGQQQQFFVPNGATSFYLGFADSFDSVPSYYADNTGSLDAEFQIATPEPSTLITGALGAILAGIMIKRKTIRA